MAKPAYCTALSKAGYQNQLQFQPPRGEGGRRNRARKITWFTPPFNIAARCDMNRLFQRIIANAFPPGHEYLNKLFNTRNLKLSYSTTPNLGSIINSHNSYIMKNYKTAGTVKRMCNCQVKASCPMKGKCLAESLVYRADVTTSGPINEKKFYIGACSLDFKGRFRNHQKSLRHERYKTETALSLYVWEMKEKGAGYLWPVLYHYCVRACVFLEITNCLYFSLGSFYILSTSTGSQDKNSAISRTTV